MKNMHYYVTVSFMYVLWFRIDFVGSACIKMWAKKLETQFTNYLQDAEKKLKSKQDMLISERNGLYYIK